MVGVAILGAGDIANVHIEAYNELAGRCRIVALADIYTDKAEAKKQKYGLDCDVVADYKELLGREDVDLVSVCLPPAAHGSVPGGMRPHDQGRGGRRGKAVSGGPEPIQA